jgi:molecular chaperone DnaK (HSP70)
VQSEWGVDLSRDPEGVQRLRRAVIQAKEELSFVPETQIRLEYKGKTYARAIDRELFDRLIAPIVERTLAPCRACLTDSKLTPEQIDEVVMVGGSTRIPLVRAAV